MERRTKVCGIDFDETLFMTLDAWGEAYTAMTGNEFTYPTRWDFKDVMSDAELKMFWTARVPAIYENPSVVPCLGAQWLVDWLLDNGWTVVVPTTDTRPFAEVKRRLLEVHYPRLAGKMVIAKDKWSVVGMDILIDDCPTSGATFFPARPYNSMVPAANRFTNLRHIARRLREVT